MTSTNAQSQRMAKLRGLRLALRGRLAAEGLAWVLAALAGLVVVTFAFDYALRLDRPLRAIIVASCLAGVLVVLVRRLIAPQCVAMTAESLAMLIESRYRHLGDRFISALQLADRGRAVAAGMSGAMIDRVAAEAGQQIGSIKFNAVVDRRRLARAWGLALAMLVLVGGFTAARGDLMNLWLQRNVLFRNIDWPQKTYLRVFVIDHHGKLQPLLDVAGDGTITHAASAVEVLRGNDLEVVVETTAGSEAPDIVTLHAWYPSEGDTEQQLNRLTPQAAQRFASLRPVPAAGERHYYHKKFLAVSEAFRFHVTGGDDRRDAREPHQVRLLDPPALRDLRFTVDAPPYMRRAGSTVLDGGRGILAVHLGSTITVQARTSKDLADAWILVDETERGEINIDTAPDTGAPRLLQGRFLLRGTNTARTEALQILLRDTDGYTNRRGQRYILQIIPDREPEVSIVARGVRNVVAPTAMLPIQATARDDIALRDIRVTYSLAKAEAVGEGESASVRRVQTEPVDVETPIGPADGTPTDASGERILDIQPLKLAPGSEVIVTGIATDLLPPEYDGPNVVRSRHMVFTVISRDELMGQLVAKQKEVRMEFFQAAGQHQLSLGRSEALLDALAGGVPANAAVQIGDAMAKEQSVVAETLRAADALDDVATELELNRLGKAEDVEGIRSQLVLPLRQLLRMMNGVVASLEGAAGTDAASPLRETLTSVVARQTTIAQQMELILKRMQKLENRVELARRLEGLLNMSIELQSTLKVRAEEGTAELFEPAGDDDDDDNDTTP
ncbi:MAG: hypothetical protein KGY81_02860 [Phycisphaerae bacterium]|nr:hypothetical protein [Phycisphaerae bacterium]